jgi:L-seryl-tRNA(Ser) seleniumtransferase
MKRSVSRRHLLRGAAAVPALAAAPASAAGPTPDYMKELGVRPIINAAGAYTMFTGSLMRPEVVEAYRSMSGHFVRIDELHDAVGARIAKLLGTPAAMVPSGAAAALTVGTAGILTGTDPDKIQRIPDLRGMKSEVIVQKSHRFPYDHMVRNCGIRLIEIESKEELERAINPSTAMLLYLNKADGLGQIRMREFVQIGKKHSIPTFNDCAADVPPIENLMNPIRLGFDLICVSGGKGIRGPQSAGILAGRADLIAAARLNTAPHSDTIGRSCKVNKEEMVGMLVALESFLREDHPALYKEWDRRIASIQKVVSQVEGLKATPFTPPIANQVPHLRLEWDAAKLGMTAAELKAGLRSGDPSIELVPDSKPVAVELSSQMLAVGEAEIIARRIVEVFKEGA